MFQLDEKFLDDIGLGEMPEDQKRPFLQHIYDELELRVGTKLSEGMSDKQLEEFEAIIDRKEDVVNRWLDQNNPEFKNDPMFQKIIEATGLAPDDVSLKAEYTATRWLELNRPDYREVVSSVLEAIKQEIIAGKDSILGANQAA
ncbi:hypothetical protein HGB24_00230 [Candidatus Saccharibacteria bacterium]|nr:hypothetical protein [Candidatus Saccharibacteria bacterium]